MTSLPHILLQRDTRRGEPVIRIDFKYDKTITEALKKKTPAAWSANLNCWYINEKRFNLGDFFAALRTLAYIDYSALQTRESRDVKPPPVKEKETVTLPAGYLEQLQQVRYSANTINIYTHYFKDFASAFAAKELGQVTKEEINAYILQLIKTNNISISQQNQRINAIKFYYEKVLLRKKE